jgi:outer membrane protein assembly factor BamB
VSFFDRFSKQSDRRPVDWVFEAEGLWHEGTFQLAEKRFEEGIDRCRKSERDDLTFALGRFGAFLIDQGRTDEATGVLREAIEIGTDIPAIWSDYLRMLADHHDLDAFISTSERLWSGQVFPREGIAEFLLSYARRASREEAAGFAEALARHIMSRCESLKLTDGSWAAAGDLGEILERAGRADEAIAIWSTAWQGGSKDATTANRLSLNLERRREYQNAIVVIREALDRMLPANTEEQLRRRLARCEAKVSGSGRKTSDVEAFSIRSGTTFKLVYQARTTPPTQHMQLLGNVVRCFRTTKGQGIVTDLDLDQGSVVNRIEGLPDFYSIQWADLGIGIGAGRTGPVGQGPTKLEFLRGATLAGEASVPDATSEIAWSGGSWLVGCRDGFLYCLETNGGLEWRWETPGRGQHDGDVYSRPCPYLVRSGKSMHVAVSMGNLYGVDARGKSSWSFAVPNERADERTVSVPVEDENGERAELTFSISFTGMGPIVADILSSGESVLVGSSAGFLYELEQATGRRLRTVEVGTGAVRLGMTNDARTPVWCDGRVSLLEGTTLIPLASVEQMPQRIIWAKSRLYVWDHKSLQIVGADGETVWRADFSKPIESLFPLPDGFICSAGVITRFAEGV